MYTSDLTAVPSHCSMCCCSDNQLVSFNRKLESLKWDMTAWRSTQQKRTNKDSQEAFELLNLSTGGGWDLLTNLMQYQPNKRLSASTALRHRWFGTSILAPVGAAFDRVTASVGQVCRPTQTASLSVVLNPRLR